MNILFLCTHNRCRSILAEATLNSLDLAELTGYSAGSSPVDAVHPASIRALKHKRISTDGLYSKSWDTLDHLEVDLVVTVCDDAAKETCPLWLGGAPTLHYPLSDPSRNEPRGPEGLDGYFETCDAIAHLASRWNNDKIWQLNSDELRAYVLNFSAK